MSTTNIVKEFVRIATVAGLTKDVNGLPDKKSSLCAEREVTSQELRIIYDRLRHTLDLIPLSTSESHPKLFQVRQDILKQTELLSSLILDAVKNDVKMSGHKKEEK
jgi:phage terminase Nu1 subunit (DNA packaging protein)